MKIFDDKFLPFCQLALAFRDRFDCDYVVTVFDGNPLILPNSHFLHRPHKDKFGGCIFWTGDVRQENNLVGEYVRRRLGLD